MIIFLLFVHQELSFAPQNILTYRHSSKYNIIKNPLHRTKSW